MATRKNNSYNRGDKHRGEHGNTVKNVLQYTVKAADAAGDVIVMDTGPWQHQYLEISVETGGTTGLTVDVGVQGSYDDFSAPTLFGSAIPTAAADKTYLLTNPMEVVNADNRKIEHDVIITLGGTVTAGDEIWLVTEAIYNGAPE